MICILECILHVGDWLLSVQKRLASIVLQIFWSATFMSVPDILLQEEQFSGWMMCLHQAMRRPLPWVSR